MSDVISIDPVYGHRHEHLAWAKDRALAYVERGDMVEAWASLVSDLNRHAGTRGHVAIELGMRLLAGGCLSRPDEMRDFIEGFN